MRTCSAGLDWVRRAAVEVDDRCLVVADGHSRLTLLLLHSRLHSHPVEAGTTVAGRTRQPGRKRSRLAAAAAVHHPGSSSTR